MIQQYTGCGTCGSTTLVLEAKHVGRGLGWAWELRCGNDHRWVVIPGTVLTLQASQETELQAAARELLELLDRCGTEQLDELGPVERLREAAR